MLIRRLSFVTFVLLLLSLTATADTLTFIGSAPNPQDPSKYFGQLSSGTAQFTLIAPISTLLTGGGGTYTDDAVLVIQTGAGAGPIGTTFLYNSGVIALYSTSNWDFTTRTGTNALFAGALGNSSATLAVAGGNLITAFTGSIASGTYFGSFGGYDLTQNVVDGGGFLNLSLDISADANGLNSLPLVTVMQTTPEPTSMLLLASGLAPFLWRRRR
jgi:hypothetical protein